jgi:very-short-patch-repair endonuclease
LQDKPSKGEIKLFQERGTTFQLVSVVLSLFDCGEIGGVRTFKPFAVTLMPAAKRNAVETANIDAIAKLDVSEWLKTEPMYTGYDPFAGDWRLYGNFPGYFDGARQGFIDEIGIVVDQFFLATEIGDDEVLMMDMKMPSEDLTARCKKHRITLLFKPFQKIEARRVWGAETPIELFLIQALTKEKLFPQCQILIMQDGTTFPSFFHFWRDPKIRNAAEIVTSVDLYFPTERVAVFCDGSSHSRKKNRERDVAIDAKLQAAGIKPLRILGSDIKFNLSDAVKRVQEAVVGTEPKVDQAAVQQSAG